MSGQYYTNVENSGSGSISSLNGTLEINVPASATAIFVVSGTWSATLTFEASVDGTNWFSKTISPVGTGSTADSTTTSNGTFAMNVGGFVAVRIRASAYTSGTINIAWSADVHPNPSYTLTRIKGNSDGSFIGNTGDRLKVDASVVLAGGATQSYTSKLRYEDMNATTGTLARLASVTAASGWNKVYGYTGSGLLSGCVISLETKDDWHIRIVVDGEEIFGTGTGEGMLSTDLHTDSIYDSDTSGRSVPELDQDLGVFWGAHDRFQWVGPLLIPITFTSSVNIYIKRSTGAATKKFQAGFVVIEKRT